MSAWKTIVVGVDGSAGSRAALTWAAAEASDHRADLVVVNVWEHTLLPPAGSVSVSEHYVPDPSQRTADDLLKVITEELGEDRSLIHYLAIPPSSFPVVVEHPELGRSYTYPGAPYRFTTTPWEIRRRAPLLAEDQLLVDRGVHEAAT